MLDDSPDTSYLGEYGNEAESDYAIDRRHDTDCAVNRPINKKALQTLFNARGTVADIQFRVNSESDNQEWEALEEAYTLLDGLAEGLQDCDCGGRGIDSHSYEYFNPNQENYAGLEEDEIKKYCLQDYERMESLDAGYWHFVGIRAEARIAVGEGSAKPVSTQTITSGGLWGLESDMSKSDFEETEAEELSQLKSQLKALGFSTRAISAAFKNVEHKEA